MSDNDERTLCGEPCKTGGACKNPATNADGSCHISSHGQGDGGSDPGRPSKLTRERQEAICADLEEGYSIGVAAETNGIAEGTYHRWRKRGKAAKEAGKQGPFRDFHERTTRARRQGERKWTERAFKFAVEADSFGAAMEILRKRYPDQWGDVGEDDDKAQALKVLLSDGEDHDRDYAMTPDEAGVDK